VAYLGGYESYGRPRRYCAGGVKMDILNEEKRFPSFTPGVKYA